MWQTVDGDDGDHSDGGDEDMDGHDLLPKIIRLFCKLTNTRI
jgi:hypothetical protein